LDLVICAEEITGLRAADVFVIISSYSGAGLAEAAYDDLLLPLLTLFSIGVSIHQTTSKVSHCESLAAIPFSPNHETLLVILGGDTMIYDILDCLPSIPNLTTAHQLTLFLIPWKRPRGAESLRAASTFGNIQALRHILPE
jgi:hypothetical protein